MSRGNTITPRNKSSGLGLASSTSTPMVSDAVKPPIVSKAKPKATTESALKTTPVVPEKKSIVAKKEATVKTPEIKSEKVIPKEVKTDASSVPMPKQLMDIIKTSKNQDDMVSKLREASNNSYEFRDAITAYEKAG